MVLGMIPRAPCFYERAQGMETWTAGARPDQRWVNELLFAINAAIAFFLTGNFYEFMFREREDFPLNGVFTISFLQIAFNKD
jgi:hypothetical protein